MPRSLVALIVVIVLVIAALFFFAHRAREVPQTRVEKAVSLGNLS